jgi:23S rRNA (adenine2030-N6)-methyltransferase
MLSYRHGFHAGNFADVHKHVVLTLLIAALKRKDKGFCYVDTHAGAGRYDLRGEFAGKLREYENGIGRVWLADNLPAELEPYRAAVCPVDQPAGNDALRYYPGSPLIVRRLLRDQDRMVLMELHNTEAPVLAKLFAGDRQVMVHHQDGYQGLKACLPPRARRGLVLIDPAYERADEFERVVAGVEEIQRLWPTGMIAIWYPVQVRAMVTRLHRLLRETGIRKMLLCELLVQPDDVAKRLNGSGMIIINPPWQLDTQLAPVMRWLDQTLAVVPHARPVIDWLVPE